MTGIAVVLLLQRARPVLAPAPLAAEDSLAVRCPDARLREEAQAGWGIDEVTLIETAAALLVLANSTRAMLRDEAVDRAVELQRGCIALAARGLLLATRCDLIPSACFTSPGRLFAWTCAVRSAREFGRRSRFFHVRYLRVLAAFPAETEASLQRDRLLAMRELNDDTDAELDAAEALEPDHGAPAALLFAHRSRRTFGWLVPVLAALDRGDPMLETAAMLRQAADIFEGHHDHDHDTTETEREDRP